MDLPEEVVIEILVRLPVKSLLRFQCVCKLWRGLIRSPRFMDFHLNQNTKADYMVLKWRETKDGNNVLSFFTRSDGLLRPSAPDFPALPHDAVDICGPCNGICLTGMSFCYHTPDYSCPVEDRSPLYLCNLATREFHTIPIRPFGSPHFSSSRSYTVLSYSCEGRSFGLGYDRGTNEYKVVANIFFREQQDGYTGFGIYQIEIFDLRSNSWRVSDTVLPTVNAMVAGSMVSVDLNYDVSHLFESGCGLFFNGNIHWMVECYGVVLCFDVSSEEMRHISFPRTNEQSDGFVPPPSTTLLVLDDCLAVVVYVADTDRKASEVTLEIWVMTEYGNKNSWVLRFSLGPFPEMPIVLTCLNDDLLIMRTYDGELASLNLLQQPPQLQKHTSRGYTNRREGIRLEALTVQNESLVRLR